MDLTLILLIVTTPLALLMLYGLLFAPDKVGRLEGVIDDMERAHTRSMKRLACRARACYRKGQHGHALELLKGLFDCDLGREFMEHRRDEDGRPPSDWYSDEAHGMMVALKNGWDFDRWENDHHWRSAMQTQGRIQADIMEAGIKAKQGRIALGLPYHD